jgi:Domain of unknown function (DUF4349)
MRRPVFVLALIATAFGCASKAPHESTAQPAPASRRAPAPAAAAAGEGAQPAGDAPAPPVPRKLIHNATLELLAADFDAARRTIAGLIESTQALITQSEFTGTQGTPRVGHWVVRVPVLKYQSFMDAAVLAGEAVVNRSDAHDVSEQFVDLDARLKSKRVEEERLQQIIKELAGKLSDVLQVEHELTRVRGEIEQIQGRLQKLNNLVELATVTLTLRERKGYVPPHTPAFATTVTRTFHDSLDVLTAVGQSVVLVAVALAPWLPILAVGGGVGWYLIRRRRRLIAATAP